MMFLINWLIEKSYWTEDNCNKKIVVSVTINSQINNKPEILSGGFENVDRNFHFYCIGIFIYS